MDYTPEEQAFADTLRQRAQGLPPQQPAPQQPPQGRRCDECYRGTIEQCLIQDYLGQNSDALCLNCRGRFSDVLAIPGDFYMLRCTECNYTVHSDCGRVRQAREARQAQEEQSRRAASGTVLLDPSGRAAQGPARPATDCTLCSEDFTLNEAGDDYVPGTAWWCSGNVLHRSIMVCCTTCKNKDRVLGSCTTPQCIYALAEASMKIPPVPVAYQMQFTHEIAGCRGRGKKQEGMLCYAAAAATAILWGTHQDMSIYECMHDFIMSGPGTGGDPDFVSYQKAYARVTSKAPWSGQPAGQVIDQVFRSENELYPDCAGIFRKVTTKFGTPVFPIGVQAQPCSPSISSQALSAAIMGNKPVLMGTGDHWVVIFGIHGKNQNEISRVAVYNPMKDEYRDEPWTPETKADYYIVG